MQPVIMATGFVGRMTLHNLANRNVIVAFPRGSGHALSLSAC
ncbi:hypothetical protein SAMN05518861_1253 [Mesorhizobium sp. YR577]|nr:hypothetical protein SAMN05518861_1253 [Mesorhizobium sp. YR577]